VRRARIRGCGARCGHGRRAALRGGSPWWAWPGPRCSAKIFRTARRSSRSRRIPSGARVDPARRIIDTRARDRGRAVDYATTLAYGAYVLHDLGDRIVLTGNAHQYERAYRRWMPQHPIVIVSDDPETFKGFHVTKSMMDHRTFMRFVDAFAACEFPPP